MDLTRRLFSISNFFKTDANSFCQDLASKYFTRNINDILRGRIIDNMLCKIVSSFLVIHISVHGNLAHHATGTDLFAYLVEVAMEKCTRQAKVATNKHYIRVKLAFGNVINPLCIY